MFSKKHLFILLTTLTSALIGSQPPLINSLNLNPADQEIFGKVEQDLFYLLNHKAIEQNRSVKNILEVAIQRHTNNIAEALHNSTPRYTESNKINSQPFALMPGAKRFNPIIIDGNGSNAQQSLSKSTTTAYKKTSPKKKSLNPRDLKQKSNQLALGGIQKSNN